MAKVNYAIFNVFLLLLFVGCVSQKTIEYRFQRHVRYHEIVSKWFDNVIKNESNPERREKLTELSKIFERRIIMAGLYYGMPNPPLDKVEEIMGKCYKIHKQAVDLYEGE